VQVSSSSESASAGLTISFGSATERMKSQTSEKELRGQLDYIFQEVVRIRESLEEIRNPLKLTKSDAYTSTEEKNIMPEARAARVAESIEDFAKAFNAIFDENKLVAEEDSSLEDFLETLRSDLKSAVQGGFGSTMTDVDSGYGIAFDFGTTANRIFDFSLLDKMDFVKKLSEEGSEVNELFFGLKRKDDDGLIEKILNALESHEDFLKDIKGTTGVFVDTKA